MLRLFRKREQPAVVQAPVPESPLQRRLAEKIAQYEYRQGKILEDDLGDDQATITINGRIKLVSKLPVPRGLS